MAKYRHKIFEMYEFRDEATQQGKRIERRE